MIDLFEQEKKTVLFIDKVIKKYQRYARDQFMVLEKSIQMYPLERDEVLEHCIENKLWSTNTNDFRDVSTYLNRHKLEKIPQGIENTSSTTSPSIQLSTRSMSEYVKIMGGEMHE